MKKRFVFISLATGGLIATVLLFSGPAKFSFTKATTCEHSGNHYALKEADISHSGHKEFWACCKCHESFLENPGGTFVDQDDSMMVGGLDETHIAYLAPKGEGYTLIKDFEEMAANETFGGWVAVKDNGNTYIKASGSGWLTPIETALLYNDELGLTDSWTMSADLYLVGNVAGNLSFTSNTFSTNDEGKFNKFIFWHTDENNGYTQVKQNSTNSDDGSNLLDCGWLTQHGFDAGTVGNVAHNAWFNLKMVREGATISLYANNILQGSDTISGLQNIKDIKFRICMGSETAEVRLDNFKISKNSVSNDFENLANNAQFGGWTAVNDEGNTYIKASGSGWITPVETARLFDEQIELGNKWEMTAKLYLVGHVAGNISFVSNTFSQNNEGTFNKFLFWHTDENNGYIQVRRDGTNNDDGTILTDGGWLTMHDGFEDATVGSQVHDTWVDVKFVRNEGNVSVYIANNIIIDSIPVVNMLDMKDVAFRIAMSNASAEVRLDDFRIARF